MEFETLKVTLDAHIATIRLNRPDKANAMNATMWQEIRQAFEWVDRTPEARVAVLQGEGKLFCAGIDLQMMMGIGPQIANDCDGRMRESLRRMILDMQDTLTSLERCRKPVLAAVKAGSPLCLLSDMNYEPDDSVFVPFYGVQAATMPSLSRIARLGRAKVIAAIARITPDGYEIEISPKWEDFPSKDLVEDTALMNLRLQGYIDKDPAQYYWVHKRFKDRPNGESPPY